MFLSLITNQPAIALVWFAAILISLTVHEFSHAYVGSIRGDKTAERAGRLTLNPIAHIDPIGLIPLLLLGFGWAKPVPYNPYNLKDPKWDAVKIALAGPASNLILAIISGIALRIVLASSTGGFSLLAVFLLLLVILNLFLMFFNIIPIHPLDGSKLFFALFDKPQHKKLRQFVATRGAQVLMILVFISIFTSFNVFFFVSAPSYALCTGIVGESCLPLLFQIFSL